MDSPPIKIYENPNQPTYKCGTLVYTRAGLFSIFAWLLWGDFCFTLMEGVRGIIPLNLKPLGASDGTMMVIMTILPAILNATICPWVSFKSDRHRSKRGRRIPFILYTLPFLTVSLILIGCSRDITPWVQHTLPALRAANPRTVTVGLIGTFCTMFAFFDMFVGSVFWYLFNDVVPPQFLGRFIGLFQLVSQGATSLYMFLVFPMARTHMREIFCGIGLLYFVGFLIMCLKVKEGEYPPPPDDKKSAGVFAISSDQDAAQNKFAARLRDMIISIIAFLRQSFSTRLYWYVFLTSTLGTMAGVTGFYGIFFAYQMNLNLKMMGTLGGIGGLAALAATYFTAVFVDRWHPLRVAAYTAITAAVTGFGAWIWIFVTLPGQLYFWLALGGSLMGVFGRVLGGSAGIPMCMRLFPKSLYGQFSSAQAMLRSFGNIFAGTVAIGFMIGMRKLVGGNDYVYRFTFLWPWMFNCAAAVFFYLAYREWRRYGADEHYRPPAPWLPSGVEEVAQNVKSVPTNPRIVMLSFWLGLTAAIFNAVLVVIFIFFMHRHHLWDAEHWFTWSFMPVKLLLVAGTFWQLSAVRRDIRNQAKGLTTRLGIPHHGVLLVHAVQGMLYFPIFWLQTVWMIEVNMQDELIFFGIANLVGMTVGILGIHIIRYMESPVTTHNPEHAIDRPGALEPELATV